MGEIQSRNVGLLQEADRGGLWFPARKTRAIWVRRVEVEQSVETVEGILMAPAGSVVCRGEAGDVWPQAEKRLMEKYVATEEVDAEGWRRWIPHPDAAGVMAAQILHPFEVYATWGLLTGKPGDYLVKNFEDRESAHPVDVWIVDQRLFHATYERVPE